MKKRRKNNQHDFTRKRILSKWFRFIICEDDNMKRKLAHLTSFKSDDFLAVAEIACKSLICYSALERAKNGKRFSVSEIYNSLKHKWEQNWNVKISRQKFSYILYDVYAGSNIASELTKFAILDVILETCFERDKIYREMKIRAREEDDHQYLLLVIELMCKNYRNTIRKAEKVMNFGKGKRPIREDELI